jgi:hypothetical protein
LIDKERPGADIMNAAFDSVRKTPFSQNLMKPFKHYIATRFNLGIYNPQATGTIAPIRISPDEWMAQRMELFTTFTLPSMMSQTCQNFTWISLMDEQTPQTYKDMLAGIARQNIKFIYLDISKTNLVTALLENLEPGDYDLITTRLDNDDAFYKDTIRDIQDVYKRNSEIPKPWFIQMPNGYTLDLATKTVYIKQYPLNPFVTFVETSTQARTAWAFPHTKLPTGIHIEPISAKTYWLTVVHSQNAKNALSSDGAKKVHYDKPLNLAVLNGFGIDTDRLRYCKKIL